MHQPIYKDPEDGRFLLPWVRLHAVKDYLDMALLIESVPGMRAVINIVPSLFVQLEDYAKGTARDPFLDLSRKPAEKLTENEKLFLLKNFFTVNKPRKIDPSSRYSELWEKRSSAGIRLNEAVGVFTVQDYLDLQVLFNLAWCGPTLRKDAELSQLFQKERNFTQEEKELLLNKQQAVISQILPTYKRLQETGQVEISLSPFYHPILPLLCDSSAAKEPQPGITLPAHNFCYPNDAEEQVRMSLEYYRSLFGRDAKGMWPSEGAVSEEVLEIASRQGLAWLATDEAILKQFLSANSQLSPASPNSIPPEIRCSAWNYQAKHGESTLFFRSVELSNLISFVYSSWNEEDAAADLFHRLVDEKSRLPKDGKRYLCAIIMDGENAWEYFPEGGEIFLRSLYQKIVKSQDMTPMTFEGFFALGEKINRRPLHCVSPGTWIHGNFSTWIGEPAKNAAWEDLYRTRKSYEEWTAGLSPEEKISKNSMIKEALHAIHTAEGSDWFWWLKKGEQLESEKAFKDIFEKYTTHAKKTIGLHAGSSFQPNEIRGRTANDEQ